MTMLCKTCADAETARRLADALTAAGVDAMNIELLVGPRYHDIRDEPVGGFAGMVEPDARVGKFTGSRRRWQAAGGFISGSDRRRKGSFADLGGVTVVSCDDTGTHVRRTPDAGAARVLRDARVPDATAGRILNELHDGHAVLLAEVEALDARISDALIEGARSPG